MNASGGQLQGDVGRNTLRGPFRQRWDFSLAKSFPIHKLLGESGSLELRGDFFNIFNHPVFDSPLSTSAPLVSENYFDRLRCDPSTNSSLGPDQFLAMAGQFGTFRRKQAARSRASVYLSVAAVLLAGCFADICCAGSGFDAH